MSLLTGTWSFHHGCLANPNTEAVFSGRSDLPVFTRLLRDAEYKVAGVGKWHADPRHDPETCGFEEFVDETAYEAWRSSEGLPPIPSSRGWFGEADEGISPEQSRLAWGARETLRLLEQAAAGDAPFFIRWDPSEPHLPNRVPEPYASLYPPEAIPPWPNFGETFEGKPFIQRQQLRTWEIEDWKWEDWAKIVSLYLGEISLMDDQIGLLLDALDALGLAKNTLVVYSSDHGDLCGSHRMIDKHFIFYEEVIKVPLILRWPGRISSGQVNDSFVSSGLDLAKTFCEAAGVSAPESFVGKSLLPGAAGESFATGREDIFAAYHGNQFGLYSQRMVRDRRWKYIWNATAEDELYDLEEDSAELLNRAADSECASELQRLRQRLLDWMKDCSDPLLNEWTERQLARGLKVAP